MKKLYKTLSVLSVLSFALLAQAARSQDVQHGRKMFQECAACHSLDAGDNALGPSLANVLGRRAATLSGFRFSNALKKTGVTWDQAKLDEFLTEPQKFAPGNRMPYSGMLNASDRSALIEYLASLSAK